MKKSLLYVITLMSGVLLTNSKVNAQTPIFAPGMTITAFGSVNSPFGEAEDKIIDGIGTTKFLDFNHADGMGFTVDLGGTAAVARIIEMATANDFPGRDPMNFEVLGSNNGTTFTSIATGTIPCIATRFNTRTFSFINNTAYLHYRVNYTNKCSGSENSFQVAETQLYSVICGAPIIATLDSTICNGASFIINGTTYNGTNNNGTETLAAANGCDSVLTITATELAAITGTFDTTICNSDYFIFNGTTYNGINNSGTEALTAANGCDSVITITVNELGAIDTSTTISNQTITTNENGAIYQWVDCNNNNDSITGETSQSFIANTNGDYAVIVTVGNCSETSACVNIATVGIDAYNLSNTVSVSPNPTTGNVNLDFGKILNDGSVIISDITGKQVYRIENLNNQTLNLDINHFSKGVYFVKIQNNNEQKVLKLIKQ